MSDVIDEIFVKLLFCNNSNLSIKIINVNTF
jgi:hypothetical protein